MRRPTKLRRPGVVVLTVLGCLVSVLSLVTVWGRNQILDTEKYLSSVTPLASDPVIQDEVAGKVSTAISTRLDAADLAAGALPPAASFLAGPLGDAVEEFVQRETSDFVRSPAFVTLWAELNRTGHTELVRILNGEEAQSVSVRAGRLTLDLGPVVQAVRDRLVAAGLSVVATLPQIELVVDVASAQGVERAQVLVGHLDLLATVLPLVAVALLLGAVLLTRRRWTSAAAVLVAAAWSMVVARAALAYGAHLAATHVPARVASSEAVHAYYGHLTSLLHRGATLTGATFALLAAALLVGPALLASRRGSGPSGGRRAAVVLVAGLSGLVLLVWPSPGTATVVLILAGSLVVAAVARWLPGLAGPAGPAGPEVIGQST